MYNDADDTAYRRGFPCLLKVNDDTTFNSSYTSELVTSYISGRYKFKPSFVSYPNLNCCSVPVKFAHNKKNYDSFCFAISKIPWYASSSGNINEKNTTLYGRDTSSARWYLTSYTPSKIAFLEYDKITNDGEYEALTYITDNYSQYVNSVIDFGDTPQEVPKIFKEWIENNFTTVYPYTYTVKSFSGDNTLGEITEAPSMKNAQITVVGDRKTLTLTGVNDNEYVITWDSITPDGKQFLGLSTSPNSTKAIISANVSTPVSFTKDTILYEVYGTYRPIATPFTINLYQKTCENNRVDKTNYITQVGTLSGVLREESSITDVTITFTSDTIPTFNYVYIEAFNRYYYVNDITSLKKDLWQMTLSVDVLMTYRNAILSCTGFVDRNENEFNADLIDKKRVVEEGNTIEVATVTNELFTATQGTYLLNGILVSVYDKNV